MKRSIELMVVAAVVLLLGFATSALAQRLPGVGAPPVSRLPGVSVSVAAGTPKVNSGVGRVFVPESSIARPGSAGVTVHTNVEVFVPEGFEPGLVYPPFSNLGYNTPASIACRYRIPSPSDNVAGCNPNNTNLFIITTGGSQTIAIVDAYDDPWAGPDLAYFSAQFGIPFSPQQFQVVYASGYAPPIDLTGGWELEESLDIEWAHAFAPNAKIVLVEAATSNNSDMFPAVQAASSEVLCGALTCPSGGSGTGEVSMSWGTGEYPTETATDAYFGTTPPGAPGVVYLAASGDSPGVSYPCASPNVVCVGGTTWAHNPLTLNGSQEGVWENGGGGQSAYETPLPSYQSGIVGALTNLASVGFNTTYRAVPDVSTTANPNVGVWVFDSQAFELPGYCSTAPCNAGGGWWVVGGTSASTPIFTGIVNLAGNFEPSSNAELTLIYNNLGNGSAYNDIIPNYGVCGPYQGYLAAVGWDPCSGVGSPYSLVGK